MKRAITIFILIISLSLIQLVYAVEISLSKTSYQAGETLQAEITGNFIDNIQKENIFLYEGGTPRPRPAIFDITKNNNVYYLYMVLPNNEGNFSLQIKNVRYIDSGSLKTNPIIQKFTLNPLTSSSLSINPGFAITSSKLSIKVIGLFSNQDVTARLESTPQSQDFFLISDTEKTVSFDVTGLNQDTNLIINDYIIPIFVIPQPINQNQTNNQTNQTSNQNNQTSNQTTNQTNQTSNPNNQTGNQTFNNETEILERQELFFKPLRLNPIIILEEDYLFRDIIIENKGNKSLKNIKFSSNINAKITPKKISLLEAGKIASINISIKIDEEDLDENNELMGEIIAEIGSEKFKLPIFIQITENQTGVIIETTNSAKSYTCLELGGVTCQNGEICSQVTEGSLNGPCCLGICKEKKTGNSKWLIGIFIVLIVLVLVAIIMIRIKSKRRLKPPKDIIKERTVKHNERMNPVSGGLSKV